MSNDCITMTPELNRYLRDVSVRESSVQRALRDETAQLPLSQMQISPEQGQFMALLLKLIGARRTIEVGVFTGYSTLACAQALPEDGEIIACDVSEEWTSIARRYWAQAGVDGKIDLRLAPATETLQSLIDAGQAGQFDFAFIDADKENYAAYFELCLTLTRPGGLLVIDNVLWSGSVANLQKQDPDTVAIRAFNQTLLSDGRVDISMLPVSDGLTLAWKRPG